MLVGVVDAKLLKLVLLKHFKAEDVEDGDGTDILEGLGRKAVLTIATTWSKTLW